MGNFQVGEHEFTVQDLKRSDAIRWAVFSSDGRRSSTWRLWGNKKGDIYISSRTLGGMFKMSIHRDRRCSVGFTSEFENEARSRFTVNSRHWERWILPDGANVRAVQVLIVDSELRSFDADEKAPMAWVESGGPGTAKVFTLKISEPGSACDWSSPEESGFLIGAVGIRARMATLVHTTLQMEDLLVKSLEINRQKLLDGARAGGFDGDSFVGTRALIVGFHAIADPFFVEFALE